MKQVFSNKFIDFKQLTIFALSIIMYLIGGGIAHYFGANIQQVEFWLGLIWVLCIHISGFLLITYFSTSKVINQVDLVSDWVDKNKRIFLQVAFFTLTICGLVVVLLIIQKSLSTSLGIILILTVTGFAGLILSPFNLAKKGYQEIFFAIYQGSIIPATGFFILSQVYHKLLLFISFPMTCMALATFLALNFSTFARDQKIGRRTFLRSLTWQKAIPIHNVLILGVYVFFLTGYLLKFPSGFIWPALLTFPLACLQIYWLYKISKGGKPTWPFFNALITSVYLLTAYFIAFTFWIS